MSQKAYLAVLANLQRKYFQINFTKVFYKGPLILYNFIMYNMGLGRLDSQSIVSLKRPQVLWTSELPLKINRDD